MDFEATPSDTEKEIRLYLLDQLPPAEKLAVESRIAGDSTYASAVEEMRWMLTLAQVARHDRMRAQVQSAGVRARTPAGLRRGIYLSAAAAVALLAAFGTYFWTRPSLGKRLAAQFDDRPGSYKVTMGQAVNPAFKQYDEARNEGSAAGFDKAIVALQAIPTTDPDYSDAQFYLAQSYMGKHDPARAIPVLEGFLKTTTEKDMRFHDAEWYLALALLYEDRLEEARALLVPLSQLPDYTKQGKAAEILARLP
jgi:tetratricopeptide (TPR) repeat protein